MGAASQVNSRSSAGEPADDAAAAADWCDQLLKDPAHAPATCIAGLRHFIQRGLRKAFAQRRDCGDEFIEDMTQEATLRVLQNLASFKGDSQLTTWVTTVAMRAAFTELRRARWKDVSLDALLEADHPSTTIEPAARSAPESDEPDGEMLAALRTAITKLTPRQQTAINAFLSGLPTQELAQRMKMNHNAVYKLLHDARKRLKVSLEQLGISESDVRTALEK